MKTACSALPITMFFLSCLVPMPGHAAIIDVNCTNRITDTAALRSAIADSRNGDEIRLHGICLADRTIVLAGNRTYEGDSRTGTIIRQANGANLPALLASDSWESNSQVTGDPIRIAHLTVDGNASNNFGTQTLVIRSWLTVIEDLQVENSPGDGIRITNLSKDSVELTNTQVNGRISNAFITDSGGDGIHIVDTGNSVTDWDLLDSWIANSGKSGIEMDNAAGWKIRGNHVYGVKQNAIFASRCFGTSVESNYVEDFGGSGGSANTWYGIACTAQGDAASVISGNKVFQFNDEPASGNFVYIGIPQVNYGTAVLNVVDNAIRGAAGPHDTGLSYQVGGGTGLKVLSHANNVHFAGTPRVIGPGVTLVQGW